MPFFITTYSGKDPACKTNSLNFESKRLGAVQNIINKFNVNELSHNAVKCEQSTDIEKGRVNRDTNCSTSTAPQNDEYDSLKLSDKQQKERKEEMSSEKDIDKSDQSQYYESFYDNESVSPITENADLELFTDVQSGNNCFEMIKGIPYLGQNTSNSLTQDYIEDSEIEAIESISSDDRLHFESEFRDIKNTLSVLDELLSHIDKDEFNKVSDEYSKSVKNLASFLPHMKNQLRKNIELYRASGSQDQGSYQQSTDSCENFLNELKETYAQLLVIENCYTKFSPNSWNVSPTIDAEAVIPEYRIDYI